VIRSGIRPTGEKGLGWFLLASGILHLSLVILLLIQRKPLSLGYPQATEVALISENDLKKSPSPKKESRPAPKEKKIEKPIFHHAPPQPLKRQSVPLVHHRPAPRLIRKPPKNKIRRVHKSVPVKKIVHVKSKSQVLKKSPRKASVSQAKNNRQDQHPQKGKNAVSSIKPSVPVKMDVEGQRFPSYLQHLLISRIKSNWAPPPGSHGLNVTLSFVLKKDGTLSEEPILVTRSGSAVFDEAAKFAILRSVPFPPFPPSYGKDQEVVTVTLQATKRQGF